MRVLLKHASVARRALRGAELSNKFAEAGCTQGTLPAPCVPSLRCLHASAAASASKDDDKQKGSGDDNGNRLPENATAKEMRQWADKMLGHSAQQASPAEASAPAAEELAQMEQEVEEDANREEQLYSKVQAARDSEAEDDAFREEQSFDRAHAAGPTLSADDVPEAASEAAASLPEEDSEEAVAADDLGLSEEVDGEYQDAAAATRTVQGMPGVMESQSGAAQSGAGHVAADRAQSAQAEAQEEQKWQSFMAEHFGTEMASAADVRSLREEQPPPPRSPQSRIFDIKDPRKELDKLLPEEFRRFDVADKSYVKSQAGSYLGQAASEPPPRRITVMEPPVDHRADPVTGYAKLGYAGQSEDALEKMPDKFMERQEYLDKMRKISSQQRIHPTRTFYPGQTYQPEELAPDAAPGAVAWQLPMSVKPSARVKKASNAIVRAQADFRNQTFLNTFISELGKLPPKRTTRLQQKTHRHLCRQIKLARQMALLPIDSRLKPSYLARAGGLAEVPSTIEDNPVLAHLLPPHRRPAPREF